MITGLEYLSNLIICILFGWYGLPFISKGNLLLSIINIFGVLIQSTYLIIFLYYSPEVERLRILKLLSIAPCTFIFMIAEVFNIDQKVKGLLNGVIVASIVSFVYCYSFCVNIWMLIEKKNVESISIIWTSINILCDFTWLIYDCQCYRSK
ncbi:hypothetical protein MANES_18G106451v8 [Manihot esculenta]|uniref:Uncharacterized protein n=1 Tax=Manihot esculenta TaxID=3983 RepID=A0ACB7G124_MANES|nr:hypothetical protein MANES_18G106451v8 [Manihot esculenta]